MINEKILEIQTKLNAPKNQYNKFGNYAYRSLEDVMQALKPLLKETGITLTITDDLVEVGSKLFVKAVVTLRHEKQALEYYAFAELAPNVDGKKMDLAQLTGATSSYARKYALNGLFLIDDNKDFDTNEHAEQVKQAPKTAPKQNTNEVDTKLKNLMGTLGKISKEIGITQKALFDKTASAIGFSGNSKELVSNDEQLGLFYNQLAKIKNEMSIF